jgi:hypothetical protein
MMEERKTIFDYMGQLFATYGIIVLIFVVFSAVIGEGAGEYSSLFRLGRGGLTLSSLLQLLLLALTVSLSQILFLTDRIIKNMSIVFRYVLFFLVIMIAMVIMAVLFAWFPVDDIKAWIGFFISFVISMLISILLTRLEEKAENEKMQKALENFRAKQDKQE